MLFDTHSHLNAEQFEEDLQEVIVRMKEAGVTYTVVVGFDEVTIKRRLNQLKPMILFMLRLDGTLLMQST